MNWKDELRSYNEERLYRLEHPKFDVQHFLFDKQLRFVEDPHRFKVAVCSRRAGKTIACAAHLLETAIHYPDTVCLYITLSRSNAKRIIWPTLQKIIRDHGIKAHFDNTDLSVRFENESVIYLSGASDASEIEKFRGLAIKLCYIDESQSFKSYIADLIDSVLAPALMDYAGSLCLIGTPGPVPTGYFHSLATENLNDWHKYEWTFFDNPYLPKLSGKSHQELLEEELKRKGVTAEDPSIQREWFGRWVLDTDSLLLHYEAQRNHFEDLPAGEWNYILGIDLGFVDADALAVIAWREAHPNTYLVYEEVTSKQSISKLVERIHAVSKQYSIGKMVIDEGGLGKKIAEEIRRRHQIPVEPADKTRKMENYALLNDALRSGRFKAKKNSRFAQDCFLLEIDRDKTTPDKIKVKDSFHSDIVDSVLYAAKESNAYTYEEPIIRPKVGSKEWEKEQTDQMFEETLEQAKVQAALQSQENYYKW